MINKRGNRKLLGILVLIFSLVLISGCFADPCVTAKKSEYNAQFDRISNGHIVVGFSKTADLKEIDALIKSHGLDYDGSALKNPDLVYVAYLSSGFAASYIKVQNGSEIEDMCKLKKEDIVIDTWFLYKRWNYLKKFNKDRINIIFTFPLYSPSLICSGVVAVNIRVLFFLDSMAKLFSLTERYLAMSP